MQHTYSQQNQSYFIQPRVRQQKQFKQKDQETVKALNGTLCLILSRSAKRNGNSRPDSTILHSPSTFQNPSELKFECCVLQIHVEQNTNQKRTAFHNN